MAVAELGAAWEALMQQVWKDRRLHWADAPCLGVLVYEIAFRKFFNSMKINEFYSEGTKMDRTLEHFDA